MYCVGRSGGAICCKPHGYRMPAGAHMCLGVRVRGCQLKTHVLVAVCNARQSSTAAAFFRHTATLSGACAAIFRCCHMPQSIIA